MPDNTQAVFGAYGIASIPWWATLGLLLTALIYLRGWRALRRTRAEQIPSWRVTCFLLGIGAVWVAIASPLDTLSGVLLTAHMIQHLLLMAVAPPLLVLGAPMVPLLRGLPRYFVREGIGPFFSLGAVQWLERLFRSRFLAWALMNGAFLAWHTPALYDLALRSPGWHEVEHASFLFTSMLFWWHIVVPWPTTYKASRWLLLPFLLTADLVNTGLSAALSFSGRVVYPAYAAAPRFFGVSALNDQVAAGSLMWVIGSMSFLGAAMLITVRLVSRRGERRQLEEQRARARAQALRAAAVPAHAPVPARAEAPVLARMRQAGARARLDVLRIPGVGRFLKSRYGRQSLQAASLLIATAVIVDGLFGHQMGSMNLAGIVPWTFARGIFVLALLACGNLFCMSCPFTLPRDAAKWVLLRMGVKQLPWPRVLRNKWLPVSLVVLFFWAYEALDLWNAPERTAAVLLAYFATAFAVDAVFRDASFCKYVCPLGQFNFASSLLSPMGVAPRSLATCGSCSTRDCIAGHGERQAPGFQRGCELHLFQPEKQGNMDCTLCLDCVKACPHDNVGLFVQPPARELVLLAGRDPQRSGVGRYSRRMDLGALAATVTVASFGSAAVMVMPVATSLERWGARLPGPVARTGGVLLAAALPLAVLGLLALAVRLMRAAGNGEQADVPRWAMALLPLGLGMWAAHLSFHLITAWDSLGLGIVQAAHELLRLGIAQPDWMGERPLLDAGSIRAVQLALLDLGLMGTLYVGWRMTVRGAKAVAAGVGSRVLFLLPWAAIAGLLYAAGVWILLEPMQMRGMVGM